MSSEEIRRSPSGPEVSVATPPITSDEVTNISEVDGDTVTESLDSLLTKIPIINEPNTTRTCTAADAGSLIRCTNAAGCVITLNADVFEAEDLLYIRQVGAAAVSFAGTVTITPPTTNLNTTAQVGATIAIVFLSGSTAESMGDLSDA